MQDFSDSELARYSRQIRLAEIGEAGQLKLKAAKVLVVGAGGLGCPALLYLAAAGVGTLGMVDFDRVDESNLHRQVLYGAKSLGQLKVDAAKERLSDLNSDIEIKTFARRLDPSNVRGIFSGFDIIVDGSDNFATRYLVNDACIELGLPFVSGAIQGFEGQIGVFNFQTESKQLGPSYRCLFPEPPDPASVPSCAEAGVLGIVPGLIGSMQANEVLKMILGLSDVLSGKFLSVNLLNWQSSVLKVERRPAVIKETRIQNEQSYLNLCETPLKIPREIAADDLKRKIAQGEKVFLVDVREPFEKEAADIGGLLVPMDEILDRLSEIPRDREVVFYCHSGIRSAHAIQHLEREFGYSNLWNLKGGIIAFQNRP